MILDKLFGNSIEGANFLLSGQATFVNSFSANLTVIGPILLAGFFLGSDFTQRTLQQQITNGHSRTRLVLAKVIVFSLFSSVLMMITPITTTATVTIIKGWGADFTSETAIHLLRVFCLTSLLSVSAVSVYLLISFICRDIFKTLFFSGLFTLVFFELGGILTKNAPFFSAIYDFFPLNQMTIAAQMHVPIKDIIRVILSSVITWITVVGFTIYIFEKEDLN
ncbi:ABC transporter permease [Enterococcus sp. AZ128]|uniref:ABC transporter permease n=1 Tax=Enterococcus sp. AZ128 TaxID=2774630 RepID=UPI003F689469